MCCDHHDPNCEVCRTKFNHVHCRGTGCRYVLVVCPKCDDQDAVRATIADHEKDCPFVLNRAAVAA